VFDVGQQAPSTGSREPIDFLVMEYLDGETIAARLAKGPLPLDQVLRYALEISDALDKAHRKGITHRDVKPGNVMLTRNGSKLLDFGLAKPAADGTLGR
jgi:serine/threonine protein kinase